MSKLKFFKMLFDKDIIEPFNEDNNFSHFVFQNTNDNAPSRDQYGLAVYAYNKIPVLMPLNPNSLIVSKLHGPIPDFERDLLFGNFIMWHNQVSSVMINNPNFKYLKFVAEQDNTDPKFENYIYYTVFPVDKDENPIDADLTTERINPSPPA